MKRLTMLFLLAACADPTLTAPRGLPPSAPSFAADFTLPPAPANVSAVIVGDDGPGRLLVQFSWDDNTTALDEWVTCGIFQTADGGPVTTQCAYASDYDVPAGSTGPRTATLVVPSAAARVTAYVSRWVPLTDELVGSYHITLRSEMSETVPVMPLAVVATTTKKGGKK